RARIHRASARPGAVREPRAESGRGELVEARSQLGRVVGAGEDEPGLALADELGRAVLARCDDGHSCGERLEDDERARVVAARVDERVRSSQEPVEPRDLTREREPVLDAETAREAGER